MEDINYINATALKQLIDHHENELQLIDIRESYELETDGHANSIHIPMGELMDRLSEISKTKKVVFHCSSGQRSSNILNFMLMNNLYQHNYYSLEGGFKAWLAIS
jgi:rhodanese-related sulfurtransferase